MATSMEIIGDELKTRLATITDIARVFAPNGLPLAVSEFPVALILPAPTEYHQDFDDSIQCSFRVIILLTNQDNPTALTRLLDYIATSGADSVMSAVEASTTNEFKVVSNNGAGVTTWGGQQYLSTEFLVICYN